MTIETLEATLEQAKTVREQTRMNLVAQDGAVQQLEALIREERAAEASDDASAD